MDEYEVRVTRQALEQMKEIVHYISYDLMSPAAADNLLDKFKAEILKLSSLPKKYARIEEEPWRTEGIRKMVVQKFLIYYWVDDDNSRVQVTAVIYGRRDQIRQLANMDMEWRQRVWSEKALNIKTNLLKAGQNVSWHLGDFFAL